MSKKNEFIPHERNINIDSELPRSKLRSIKGIRPRTDSSNQE